MPKTSNQSAVAARLSALLFPAAPAKPKTRKVAVYPDGRRYVLRRAQGVWWWDTNKGSHPLAAAIEHVEECGGHVITEKVPA